MDSIARDNQRWIGIHRWTRGLHKAPTKHRVLAAAGPLAAGLVTVGSIWLLLSGFGQPPHGKIPPQVLPGIVATQLPPSGSAVSSSIGPAPSTQGTADRTAGTTPSPANEGGTTPEMAGAPVPAPTPTPAATTAAADAPPPLPPPVPVLTSTPPVCPPLPTPGKSKKAKPSHPSHW